MPSPDRWKRYLLLGALAILLLNAVPLRAQQTDKTAAGTEKTASPSTKVVPETLLELILAGGPVNIGFMVILTLCSLVGMAVILERLVNLTTRKLIPPEFVHDLQEMTRRQEDKPQPFRELCERYPSLIANVLKAGLFRAGRPVSEVEKGMEDAAARELAVLRSRVRPLTVLAAVGPLVGLLGTAVGMILVFREASRVGLGRADELTAGIYLKLMTTVGGLIVAIPSLLFAALFNSRSEKLLRQVDVLLMETIPCFIRMERSEAAGLGGEGGRQKAEGGKQKAEGSEATERTEYSVPSTNS